MEIIITLGVVVILIAILAVVAMSPFSRRAGDKVEDEARAIAPDADVEHEFSRPRDQDDPS